MIREYALQNLSRPVDVFVYGAMAEDLILDPVYQRGSVWTDAQRVGLAKSILQGLPIGAIFLNHRSIFDTVVVDGKQRIEAIRAIVAGEVEVPAEWVTEKGLAGRVAFPDWPENSRRWFRNRVVSTYETNFAAPRHLRPELELFARINWGGTPQERTKRLQVEALLHEADVQERLRRRSMTGTTIERRT